MKSILCLLFCSLCFSLKAQIPGYLGKRLYVEASTNIFPATYGITSNFRGAIDDGYKFDVHASYYVKLNYVTGRRSCFGLMLGQFSTGAEGRLDYNPSEVYENYQDVFVKATFLEYGIQWTNFRKKRGGIAPLGRSYGLGLSVVSALEYEDSLIEEEFNELPEIDLETNHHLFRFTYQWSKRMIFQDRILFTYGLSLQPTFDVMFLYEDFDSSIEYDLRRIFAEQLRFRNIYNLVFQVGYLIN